MKIKRFTLLTASCLIIVAGLFTFNQPTKEKYFPRENTLFQQNQAIANGYQEYMKSIRNNRTTGFISYQEVADAKKIADKLPQGSKTLGLNWRFKGPDNVGGRTRAIVIDMNDTTHILAGGVSGGIWESFDGALTWAPYDEDFKISNVSAMAQSSDGTIYVGTGTVFDDFQTSDVKANGSNFVGTGLYKLTGNGNSELLIGPTTNNTYSGAWTMVNEIATDPNNSQRILVAMNTGLQESTDGGENFSILSSGECYDVEISKDQKITATFRSGRMRYSTNNGDSFEEIRFPGGSRIEMAMAPSNSNVQYAAVTRGSNRCLLGVYRTFDSWTNYEILQNTPDYFSPGGGFACQGEYDSEIIVYPDNSNKIVVGGIGLLVWNQSSVDPAPLEGEWKSFAVSNGNSSFFRNPFYVHADKHKFVFNPENPNTLFLGTDGGVGITFQANEERPEFSQANLGYNVTQFYDIAVNPNDLVLGGTQDNGTILVGFDFNTGKSGIEARGGDGFDTELFTINPSLGITSLYFGDIRRGQGLGTSISNSTINESRIYSGQLLQNCGGDAAQRYTCSESFYTVTSKWESFNHLDTKDSVLIQFNRKSIPPVKAGEVLEFESKNSNVANVLLIQDTLEQDLFPIDTLSGLVNVKRYDILGNGLDTIIVNFDTLMIDTSKKEIKFALRNGGSDTRTYTLGVKDTWNNVFATNLGFSKPLEYTVLEDRINYTEIQLTFAYETEFPDIIQSTLALCNVRSNISAANRDVWITKDVLKGGDVNEPAWFLVAGSNSRPDRLPTGTGNNTLVAEFSPDGDHLFIGLENGSIYRVDNINNIDVSQIPISAPTDLVVTTITETYRLPSFGNVAVTGIAIDPNDGNNMIITLGNYGLTNHVYRTTNALAPLGSNVVFEQIDGDAANPNTLPNTPVFDAIIDRRDRNVVLVGTEMGVFATENAFAANPADVIWTEENTGMGRVPAMDLEQMTFGWDKGAKNEGKIYVGTHGRGAFEADELVGINDRSNNNSNTVNKSKELRIYPNPVNEILNIELEANTAENSIINVYNIKGQLVREFNNVRSVFGNTIQIDLSDLENGSYIIQYMDETTVSSARLIKQ